MIKILNYVRVPKTGSYLISTNLFNDPNYIIRGTYHLPYVVMSKFQKPYAWITFARDPLQMYCSFYYFMYKRVNTDGFYTNPLSYTHNNAKNIELLKNKVSLEEFLMECPPGQFLPYFWSPMTPDEFDFVGITDNMSESLAVFNKMFGSNIPNVYLNHNSSKPVTEKYQLTPDVIKKFQNINAKEFELFEQAKIKFAKLLNHTQI